MDAAARPERSRVIEILRSISEAFPEVSFMAPIGSLAKGCEVVHDVDVAVLVSRGDKYEVLGGLIEEISERLGAPEELVDVVDLEKADAVFKARVLREGVVIVDRGASEEIWREISEIVPEAFENLELSIREWMYSSDPGAVDPLVVKKRLDFARSEVSFLREYVLSKSSDEIASSPVLRRLLERSYQLIVEAILDICRHVASAEGWRAYTSREFIEELNKHKIISRDLADRLVRCVKMRSVIIHRYLDVDYSKLYEETEDLIGDLEEFEEAMTKYLREKLEKRSRRFLRACWRC